MVLLLHKCMVTFDGHTIMCIHMVLCILYIEEFM